MLLLTISQFLLTSNFRYLHPYTSFLLVKDDQEKVSTKINIRGIKKLVSQLSYLTIFVILTCPTQKIKDEDRTPQLQRVHHHGSHEVRFYM